MKEQVNVSHKISPVLSQAFREMGQSYELLLKNYALDFAIAKCQKYEAEAALLENKYHCSFSEFKNRIERMENEENFEWEDDLMDWEFATENIKYWKDKIRDLQNVSTG